MKTCVKTYSVKIKIPVIEETESDTKAFNTMGYRLGLKPSNYEIHKVDQVGTMSHYARSFIRQQQYTVRTKVLKRIGGAVYEQYTCTEANLLIFGTVICLYFYVIGEDFVFK